MIKSASSSFWLDKRVGVLVVDLCAIIFGLISSNIFYAFVDTTPNVDYFTRDELRKIVREFKQKIASGEDNEVSLKFPSL